MNTSRPGDMFQPGDLVNNTYRIESVLGRGGTSDVYRARSEISGRLVALKVLKAEFSGNDDYLSLLTREEEIREIRHDAVVRYSENNRTPEGHVYLLMDYVDGPGLDRKLKQGPMPADELLVICKRVCEGLHAAHSRNIVHRDLSPDNIILRGGNPAEAVIIDFGIAKDTNPGAETIVGNEFAGKYAYAAPEQLAGKTDARTDIYSLGALLLACFRGEAPQIGKNPMEVVQNKSKPLDLEGVPEPLKSLLARMTEPELDKRFQSAADVLAALDGNAASDTPAPDDDDEDRTIIVPKPSQREEPEDSTPQTAAPVSEEIVGVAATSKPAPPPGTEKKSRTPLFAILLGLVLIIGGAGAYFGGLLDTGPKYAAVSPFTLVIDKPADAPISVSGYVPSEDMRDTLTQLAEQEGGESDLTLASGEIASTWSADVTSLLGTVGTLENWRLEITNNKAELIGETSDEALYTSINEKIGNGFDGALEGRPVLKLIPLFLPAKAFEQVLLQHADCGPLQLVNPPSVGYGQDTPVVVSGTLSSASGRASLETAVKAIAHPRPVTVRTDVLNPTLCLIENFLPKAPSGGVEIAFANGDRDDAPNIRGDFVVGENPVIDVILPASLTEGYLSVSVLDVSGNVFHLLPNIGKPDNAIATLRDGASGDVPVRVAFSIAQSQESGGLAFRVDDSTLGKSKVVAILSDGPLFTNMRPTTESASGYAQALRDSQRASNTTIHALDSRILTTLAR